MDSIFETASMMLIDDHMDWLEHSDQAHEMKHMMSDTNYMWDCRTLHINGRRQAGHSTLARRLAFDIGSDVGLKYSTIIIAPTVDRARHDYTPDNMWFGYDEAGKADQLKQCLADDYARELQHLDPHKQANYGGKVLAAQRVCNQGMGGRQFIRQHKDSIFELTGKKVDNINLCIIDGYSSIKTEHIDSIYQMFGYDVDLFVNLQ